MEKDNLTYVEQDGFRFYIRIEKHYQDVKLINHIVAGDEYGLAALNQLVTKPPKVIFDIGAHIGTFSLLALRYWPDAMVIAVEPVEENGDLYEMKIKYNYPSKKNVHLIRAAVCYDREKTCLIKSARTTGGFALVTAQDAKTAVRRCWRETVGIENHNTPTITIEQILKDFNIDKVDIAKWDCEGSELDAFRNMSDDTAGRFRFMVGEIHICHYGVSMPLMNYWATMPKIIQTWKTIRRKFPHLLFQQGMDAIGIFHAAPKEILVA